MVSKLGQEEAGPLELLHPPLKLGLAILSVTSLLTGEGPELSVGWQEQPHTQLRCRVAFGSPLTWPGL